MSTLPPASFILKNGQPVTIRPLRPDDAPRLTAFVARLSPESRFFRFMEYVKELSPAQALAFANIDYRQRMALAAVVGEGSGEQVIGVARYALQAAPETGASESNEAEVAVVVEDAYQSQGLGSRLLKALTDYARRQAIQSFTATIYPTNERILRFISHSGLPFRRRFVDGAWQITIQLGNPPASKAE